MLTILLKKTSLSSWPTFMRTYRMLVNKLTHKQNPENGLQQISFIPNNSFFENQIIFQIKINCVKLQ